MKKLLGILLTTLMSVGSVQAASVSLVEYGTENGVTSISPLTTNANVTATDLIAGPGLGLNPGSTFNINSWDNSSFEDVQTTDDAWAWSITALADISLTTLDLRLDRSGTGPTDFEIRAGVNLTPSSTLADLSSVLIGSPSTSGTDYLGIDLSSFSLNTGDTINFLLVGFNASAQGGTLDLETFSNDVALRISGDVAPVPVPAAVWLFGSALIRLAQVRRKKS